ncbi:RNA polymerase alpha subunit [Olea europaea subsp. europaea]|uniref:RNA polymerase alpha subunit (Chloroplast) n=1 Tax=Olea europaea subsp. europaea TaxID=158383 RepID=A0A8S0Q9V5_OLEEU|nr:RNA polymerase alpha subunit [Olea europaea subsp. europaea]
MYLVLRHTAGLCGTRLVTAAVVVCRGAVPISRVLMPSAEFLGETKLQEVEASWTRIRRYIEGPSHSQMVHPQPPMADEACQEQFPVMIKGPGLGRDVALRAIRISVSTRTIQWECVESREDSKRLYYGRFILSPLMKGQADTIGIAMRRALLGEIEGTCITRVKSENVPHEYSTIAGIQESVHEIFLIIFKGEDYSLYQTYANPITIL